MGTVAVVRKLRGAPEPPEPIEWDWFTAPVTAFTGTSLGIDSGQVGPDGDEPATFFVFGFMTGVVPTTGGLQLAIVLDPAAPTPTTLVGAQNQVVAGSGGSFLLPAFFTMPPGEMHNFRLRQDLAVIMPPGTIGGMGVPPTAMRLFGFEVPGAIEPLTNSLPTDTASSGAPLELNIPFTRRGSGTFLFFGFASANSSGYPQLSLILDPEGSAQTLVLSRQFAPSLTGASLTLLAPVTLADSNAHSIRLQLDATVPTPVPGTLAASTVDVPAMGMVLMGFEVPPGAAMNLLLATYEGSGTVSVGAPLTTRASITSQTSGQWVVFGFASIAGSAPGPQLSILANPDTGASVIATARQYNAALATLATMGLFYSTVGASDVLQLQLDADTGTASVPASAIGSVGPPLYGMVLFGWELP